VGGAKRVTLSDYKWTIYWRTSENIFSRRWVNKGPGLCQMWVMRRWELKPWPGRMPRHHSSRLADPQKWASIRAKFAEHLSLLKKSMSARLAVQKGPKPRPKHSENVVFSPWFRG
jgi:hypothetical protein